MEGIRMRCELRGNDYLLVSDGTQEENAAILIISDLMFKANLPDDEVNNFGCGFDGEVAKNFVYLPEHLHAEAIQDDEFCEEFGINKAAI
jgi:hypothetical protein